MRRLLWMGVGATVGVLVVRRLGGTVTQYAPAPLADNLAVLGEGVRDLVRTVREGMAEREGDLRHALGLDTHTLRPGARWPEAPSRLLEDPAGPRAPQG